MKAVNLKNALENCIYLVFLFCLWKGKSKMRQEHMQQVERWVNFVKNTENLIKRHFAVLCLDN